MSSSWSGIWSTSWSRKKRWVHGSASPTRARSVQYVVSGFSRTFEGDDGQPSSPFFYDDQHKDRGARSDNFLDSLQAVQKLDGILASPEAFEDSATEKHKADKKQYDRPIFPKQ